MMEKMVREIRAREIDYTAIDPAESQNYIKFIGDEFGSVVEMIWDGSNISYSVTTPSTGALSANLNADDIEVVDLKFYIIPDAENTWGSDPDPIINIQPRVIIFLKLKNKSINPNFQKEILLQTTVSSKVYKR
jgi:hypothetical protein